MKSNEALLLVNLGSPKNLDKRSVKEYLHVFLSDDYVAVSYTHLTLPTKLAV